MRKLILALAALAMPVLGHAQAVFAQGASAAVTIIINSAPSTTITCTPATLTAPVAAGTQVCPIIVAPPGWMGGFAALTGPDAALFAITGATPNYMLIVGSGGIPSPASCKTAGQCAVTLTASP